MRAYERKLAKASRPLPAHVGCCPVEGDGKLGRGIEPERHFCPDPAPLPKPGPEVQSLGDHR